MNRTMHTRTTTDESLETRVSRILGDTVVRARTLSGGMISDVVRIELSNHAPVVAKYATPDSRLTLEARMLDHLKDTRTIPVPDVHHAEDDLLVLQALPGEHMGPAAEAHCATLLALLHGVTADACGFGGPTLNGRVELNSPWASSWIEFFRDHRLRFSMELAIAHGQLPDEFRHDLELVSERTDHLLREPEQPSLMHGDLWAANVLAIGDQVTGFIDPSACYGDPELELAYVATFGSFGPAFWDAYADILPIDPGFDQVRRHVYALYPLLMHVYYFGKRFLSNLSETLTSLRPYL